jgi:hypothetical protein
MAKILWQKTFKLILIIFILQILALYFHWYGSIWWYDMPMHFLGGFFLSLFALSIYFSNNRHLDLTFKKLIWLSLASVFAIGVAWELFEFNVDRFFSLNLHRPIDSWSDLFFDLAGGLAFVFYFLSRFSVIIKPWQKRE